LSIQKRVYLPVYKNRVSYFWSVNKLIPNYKFKNSEEFYLVGQIVYLGDWACRSHLHTICKI